MNEILKKSLTLSVGHFFSFRYDLNARCFGLGQLCLPLLLRHVNCDLHEFVGFAQFIQYWRVGPQDVHHHALFSYPAKLTLKRTPAANLTLLAVPFCWFKKDSVVLPRMVIARNFLFTANCFPKVKHRYRDSVYIIYIATSAIERSIACNIELKVASAFFAVSAAICSDTANVLSEFAALHWLSVIKMMSQENLDDFKLHNTRYTVQQSIYLGVML